MGPIAGKPAPTGIFVVLEIYCRSWLASDGGISNSEKSEPRARLRQKREFLCSTLPSQHRIAMGKPSKPCNDLLMPLGIIQVVDKHRPIRLGLLFNQIKKPRNRFVPVSYTHLTLPTSDLV